MPSTLVLALPTVFVLAQASPTQPSTRPTQPTQATTLPTQAQTLPTQATQPTGVGLPGQAPLDAQDTRTTREGSSARDRDIEVDSRTTRDGQFDPRRARADRDAEQRERAVRVQRNLQAVGLRVPLLDADGRPVATGGVDYTAHAIVIGGYNTNVQQTQSVLDGPITRHPAIFTGVSVTGVRRSWITADDPMELTLTLRGQQYIPLDDIDQPADGSVLATAAGTYGLGNRSTFSARLFGTITTLNASRISDGPLFQVTPGTLQRTFTIFGGRANLAHQHSDRLRSLVGADFTASTTVYDLPVQAGNAFEIQHRGFDYVQPGVDASLLYDTDWRNTLFTTLRYTPLFTLFLLDFTQQPPQYRGDAIAHIGEASLGWAHLFTDYLRTTTSAGIVVATPPPLDPDQRWILSPRFAQEVAYIKPLWSLSASVGYTYGSVAPRLGSGPTVTGNFLFRGTPFHRGNWSKLTFLANVGVARAALRTDVDTLSRISFIVGGAQVRYGLTDWLGVIGGYDFRFTKFEGFGANPDFIRHVFFLGLSGYFATDRSLPTLETFVPPLQGG